MAKLEQRKEYARTAPPFSVQDPETGRPLPDFTVLDPRGLLDIPWKDVTTYKDSANISKGDPITIGAAANAALGRLYEEFGVTGLPTTWGQLMGSVAYCTELSHACSYERISKKDDAEWFAAVVKVANKYNPELTQAIIAYNSKDIKKLRQFFVANIGFEFCSQHFDPLAGWDSFPDQ